MNLAFSFLRGKTSLVVTIAAFVLSNAARVNAEPIKVEIQKTEAPQTNLSGGTRDQNGNLVLPNQFLGYWKVVSTRPKTQNKGVEKRFNTEMRNVLIIGGTPGRYYLGSSTGFQSPITIDAVAGGLATLRSVQGEQFEFGEPVVKKIQVLKLRVAKGNNQISGTFLFDLTFATGEHLSVTYNLSGTRVTPPVEQF